MKNTIYSITLIALATTILSTFSSFTNGPNEDRSGSPVGVGGADGCGFGCHTGNVNIESGFTITGLPTAYKPDSVYSVTVSIDNATAKNGFQLSSLKGDNTQAGDFTMVSGTKLIPSSGRNIIGHDSPSSSGSWTFEWQAPATDVGEVSFYGCSVASNSNNGNNGDAVYTLKESIMAETANSVEEGGTNNAFHVYPNPSQGIVFLEFENAGEVKELQVISLDGTVVSNEVLSNTTKHQLIIDAPGIYIVQIASSQGTSIKRIIVQ